MSDPKNYFEFLDLADGSRWYAKDAEAQAAISEMETSVPSTYATKQEVTDSALHPVNVNTLTPSSTFVKNAIIGINGVIYRAKQATSHFPVVLTIEDGSFVVNTVNGKIAFVVSDPTVHQDWEVFTDAAIEYWVVSLNAALAAKQDAINDLEAIRTNAQNAVKTTDQYTVGEVRYPVSALLQAVANLMSKTLVTQP